jgi:hypothetical protein
MRAAWSCAVRGANAARIEDAGSRQCVGGAPEPEQRVVIVWRRHRVDHEVDRIADRVEQALVFTTASPRAPRRTTDGSTLPLRTGHGWRPRVLPSTRSWPHGPPLPLFNLVAGFSHG